ncbi:MAG: hypothetical protein RLZZ09_2263 [Pseudomonadota bacterium]|jgi:hypothetical protein
MAEKTRIKFFGCLPPPVEGAARDGCMPTDPRATAWHVTVGGTQCHLKSVEDFAKHFDDFLRHAYQAGVDDAKAEIRERLGL